MKEFCYTVKDPLGIHARPAGLLAKEVRKYPGHIVTVTKGNQSVSALRLMGVMQLAIKQGETVSISVEGENEDFVAESIRDFFSRNM